MKIQGEYIIPYLGLAHGEHAFQLEVDDAFFRHFETSKIQKGDLKVDLIFDKRDGMVVLSMRITGYYVADCDRCTEEIKVPLTIADQVILKVEDTSDVDTDEVYYLSSSTSHIDVGPYIYETIHLHKPIVNYPVSEEAGYHSCDPKILDKMTTTDYNDKETHQADSPWSELRKLNLE